MKKKKDNSDGDIFAYIIGIPSMILIGFILYHSWDLIAAVGKMLLGLAIPFILIAIGASMNK